VDATNDIAEFLASRRAKVTPEQVGLPSYGPRRVPGLRRDRERVAKDLVAHLRSEAGRNPYDRGLSDLIGELSTRSQEFRTSWAAHDVRFHQTGVKRLRHPVVGDLDLTYEVMELSAGAGVTIAVYSADPGSRSEEGLDLLASWAATSEDETTADAR
jgi:hypothetical protein